MKLKNPKYASPVAAFVGAKKSAVLLWINARPASQENITADEIRAAFPAEAATLTDGMIAEIAAALGLSVSDE